MKDLEICKRIAEIDGRTVLDSEKLALRQHSSFKAETINNCYVAGGRYGYRYNPLTDDALCFQLMVKYRAYTYVSHSAMEDNPNREVCLAIIAIHGES